MTELTCFGLLLLLPSFLLGRYNKGGVVWSGPDYGTLPYIDQGRSDFVKSLAGGLGTRAGWRQTSPGGDDQEVLLGWICSALLCSAELCFSQGQTKENEKALVRTACLLSPYASDLRSAFQLPVQ